MSPKVCPRCGKEWLSTSRNITIWRCVCGMEYRHELNEYRIYIDGKKGPSLWWESDGKRCTLYPRGDEEEISLPYLPFTVSKEDIDKYLMLI